MNMFKDYLKGMNFSNQRKYYRSPKSIPSWVVSHSEWSKKGMCGILGGNKYESIDKVKQGLSSIVHRGKDNNTIFSFDNRMYLIQSIIHPRFTRSGSINRWYPMIRDITLCLMESMEKFF